MKANLGFNIHTLASPKTRDDGIALAYEILAELQKISDHITKAIEKCESQQAVAA